MPLLSGPPDSTLTVRQRSRKMAVIHFVPRHRQGSFSLLPITSRPDYASQQDHPWPRPTILQGAEVSGRPTLDSVSTTRNCLRHSAPPLGKLQKRCQPHIQSDCGSRVQFLFSSSKINSHYPKEILNVIYLH